MSPIEAAIKDIKEFHAIGTALRWKDAGGNPPASDLRPADQSRAWNEEQERKARQFAHPEAGGYAVQELKDLCELIRRLSPRQGKKPKVIGVSHVLRLMTVPRKDRSELQKQAIEEGWSDGALRAEIATRYGTRREGGKRRALPKDRARQLTVLKRECKRWLRLRDDLVSKGGRDGPGSERSEVVSEVWGLVEELSLAAQKLHRAVTEALEKRKPRRIKRAASRPTRQKPVSAV